MGTVEIPLTKGYVAVVDEQDADLAQFKWQVGKKLHPMRTDCRLGRQNPKSIYMHRNILERMIGRSISKGEFCDHIDNNPLNNTRSNLRLATASQNMQNSKKPCNNTSGYKGVTWFARKRKWIAQIGVNGKNIYLGEFTTPELAYEAYCSAAKRHHGEFARLG